MVVHSRDFLYNYKMSFDIVINISLPQIDTNIQTPQIDTNIIENNVKKRRRLIKKSLLNNSHPQTQTQYDDDDDEKIHVVNKGGRRIIESDTDTDTESESDKELPIRSCRKKAKQIIESDTSESEEEEEEEEEEEYARKYTCSICKTRRDQESFSDKELYKKSRRNLRCLYCTRVVSNNAYISYIGYNDLSNDEIARKSKKLECEKNIYWELNNSN